MPTLKAKPKPLPKSIGACADLLYGIRAERLAMQKLVDDRAAEETRIRDYIVDNLPKGDTGASGRVAKVVVTTAIVPVVEDWDAFYKYIARTKSFELLQRRLTEAAVRERWDAKKDVPGVGTFTKIGVSLTKV